MPASGPVSAKRIRRAYRELIHSRGLVAKEILREVRSRLSFLRDVGLGYLTLDRPAATLAGGRPSWSRRLSIADADAGEGNVHFLETRGRVSHIAGAGLGEVKRALAARGVPCRPAAGGAS